MSSIIPPYLYHSHVSSLSPSLPLSLISFSPSIPPSRISFSPSQPSFPLYSGGRRRHFRKYMRKSQDKSTLYSDSKNCESRER
ncbi:hypothetical protein E2C01_089452 [Portunus trituberculatus]|uniref:Uncharacterized protein n=1 Tax=Portunus trituberculatus TaxID=210409 RepID=A0A5B7JC15_PORTR|nr:hypothetical protein [Portunus trituberculatus]